jgi:hypothetical protein
VPRLQPIHPLSASEGCEAVSEKPETVKALQEEAEKEAKRLKQLGWTRTDFVNALIAELDKEIKP